MSKIVRYQKTLQGYNLLLFVPYCLQKTKPFDALGTTLKVIEVIDLKGLVLQFQYAPLQDRREIGEF